jgi:predicted nucleic acid-binding protein
LIVVDASALICLLLNNPPAQAGAVQRRLRGETVHAPHLIDLEVTQTLRRLVLIGNVSVTQASAALGNLALFPLMRHPHYHLLGRVWQLRSNVTAYDAIYLALADSMNASVVTLDARMARAGVSTAIEVF